MCRRMAGVVGDHVLLQDGGEDPVLQEPVAPQGAEEVVNGGLLPVVIEVVPHTPGAAQHPGNVQQLPCVEGPAVVGPVEALGHRLDAREGGGTLQADHIPGRVRLVLEVSHVLLVGLRDGGQGPLPGLGAVGLLREHPQHRRQLQCPYGFVKQFTHGNSSLFEAYILFLARKSIKKNFCGKLRFPFYSDFVGKYSSMGCPTNLSPSETVRCVKLSDSPARKTRSFPSTAK